MQRGRREKLAAPGVHRVVPPEATMSPPAAPAGEVAAGQPGIGLTSAILAICAVAGLLVAYIDTVIGFFGDHPEIGIAAGAVAAVLIISRGPVICLAALVTTAAAGGLVPLAGVGRAE